MKRLFTIPVLFSALALLSSCSATKTATQYPADDIYYTSADDSYYVSDKKQEVNTTADNSQSGEDITSGQGSTTNNYYGDVYNDYPYTSRINRFYHPSSVFNYYDPFYNPGCTFGSGWSISMNYGMGMYDPYGFGYNPYSIYNSNFYDPFYNGYSGYGYYPFGYSYSNPYMNGYYRGYNEGGLYNNYYYNNYYNNGTGGNGTNYNSNRVTRPRTDQNSYSIQNGSVNQTQGKVHKNIEDVHNTGNTPGANQTGTMSSNPPQGNTNAVTNQQPAQNTQEENHIRGFHMYQTPVTESQPNTNQPATTRQNTTNVEPTNTNTNTYTPPPANNGWHQSEPVQQNNTWHQSEPVQQNNSWHQSEPVQQNNNWNSGSQSRPSYSPPANNNGGFHPSAPVNNGGSGMNRHR